MTQESAHTQAIFNSSLLDASGQPNLVIGSVSRNELTWTLKNNQELDLVVTPFGSGKVDQNQFHFVFDFAPGSLTTSPTLQGWDVYEVRDEKGGIKSLYVALSGNEPLTIGPGGQNQATLTYTNAIQEDSNNSRIHVTLTTGSQVTLGSNPIPGRPFGPFNLTLVKATVTQSAPPLALDFVGRRTVLNDGQSCNCFTFALTNMMEADLTLTPEVTFTVWFDAAANGQNNSWALAQIQDLVSEDFNLTPPKPLTDWSVSKLATMLAGSPVNVQWKINAAKDLVLKQQEPVLFSFKGLKTDLDPGFTRMYLRFENLPGFSPGVLIGALEKTPLRYGSVRGQGLYVSAGTPKGNTPPAPNYESGLFVEQFGDGPAATFDGGRVGIGTGAKMPAAKLHIVDGVQNTDGGTLILGSDNPNEASLRFGFEAGYAWIQSHAGKPLAINPTARNVGIGTATPGSALSVAGGVAIGAGFAQNNTTIAANNLGVEGKVGIGTTDPGSSLSVAGGVAIGKSYAQNTSTIAANNLAVEGSVGIGTTTPESQLHVKSRDGIKFSLQGGGQLFISSNNDKSVQLVAISPDDSAKQHKSADFMYLGGWADPQLTLPKMILNAKEVDIQATTTAVSGRLSSAGLALTGGITITGDADRNNVLEFGFGVPGKSQDAGKIGYRVWSPGLDIVGATSDINNRQIHLWDEVYVHGNLWMMSGGYWCRLGAKNAVQPNSWDYATFVSSASDVRLKKNVTRIESPLDKLKQLNGCHYDWTDEALTLFTREIGNTLSAGPDDSGEKTEELRKAEREKGYKTLARPQLGVIAQEVEAVLPEVVTTNENGYKSVSYHQLIALLIEAIKEQCLAVTDQGAVVTRLQNEIEQIKQSLLNGRSATA